MQTNDKYRRDSLDGGTTWGNPYQFRGTDGRNGSNGTVDYSRVNKILKETYGITETYITDGKIGSPVIQGAEIYGAKIYSNEFSVFPEPGSSSSGGLAIYGNIGGATGEMFRVRYVGADPAPVVTVTAEGAGHVYWEVVNTAFTKRVRFSDVVDFSDAEVKGLHATFA